MDAVEAYARNHAEAWRHLLAGRIEQARTHDGFDVLRTADPRSEIEIDAVSEEKALLTVEWLVVDGFPLPSRQPHRPQCFLPASLLDAQGWQVWLATYRGSPASACLAFDHGGVVALYWLVTVSEYRSRGIARAVLSRVLRHHQGRDVVLVPTEDGRPLYDSLGFVEVGRGDLHTRTNAETP